MYALAGWIYFSGALRLTFTMTFICIWRLIRSIKYDMIHVPLCARVFIMKNISISADITVDFCWKTINDRKYNLIGCVPQDQRLIHWTSAVFSRHTQMGNDCTLSNEDCRITILWRNQRGQWFGYCFWECKHLGVSTWFPMWLSSDGKAMSIWAPPSGQFMYQQSVRVCWGSSHDWSSTSRESRHMWDRKLIFSWWHW